MPQLLITSHVLLLLDNLRDIFSEVKDNGKGKGSPYNRPLSPRGWVEVHLHPFMTSALRCGWVISAKSRPLHPRKSHCTHCTGGWVCPRPCLDGCGKSRSHRDSIPGPSSPYRVAIPFTLSPAATRSINQLIYLQHDKYHRLRMQ